jgi:hypothetical protein
MVERRQSADVGQAFILAPSHNAPSRPRQLASAIKMITRSMTLHNQPTLTSQ